jgi:hypothetical protein
VLASSPEDVERLHLAAREALEHLGIMRPGLSGRDVTPQAFSNLARASALSTRWYPGTRSAGPPCRRRPARCSVPEGVDAAALEADVAEEHLKFARTGHC